MSDEVPFLNELLPEFIKENAIVPPNSTIHFADQSYSCVWPLEDGKSLIIRYIHRNMVNSSFYENTSASLTEACKEREFKRKHFDNRYHVAFFIYTNYAKRETKTYMLDVDCKNVKELTEEFNLFLIKHGIDTSKFYEEDPIKEPYTNM